MDSKGKYKKIKKGIGRVERKWLWKKGCYKDVKRRRKIKGKRRSNVGGKDI